MNQRTAKALRRAVGFKPRAERGYYNIETPKIFKYPNGKTEVKILETRCNDEDSPRDLYQKAKRLWKTKRINLVDSLLKT